MIKETECLWKKRFFMIKHFQSITNRQFDSLEDWRDTLTWKGDPTQNLVECLFQNDFHTFFTFLPLLSKAREFSRP